MIVSRTPLRVSFVGGGTDLPEYADAHGGAVVSVTIDKWIRVIVAPRFEGDVRVSYSRTEIVDRAADVQHELVREALRSAGVPRGVEVITLADVPSRGTGLGSSSAVTVGALNALYAFQGIYKSTAQLAEEAASIEIDVLNKPIGRQDHYASAVGGLNLIEFLPAGGGVRVEPIVCPPECVARLRRSLLMFYTGKQRPAESILHEQRSAVIDGGAVNAMHRMRDLAYALREALAAGEAAAVGRLMHENWELKRSLVNGVSNNEIDGWYGDAITAGATGGKILGAGGGGFLLIAAPPSTQPAVRKALAQLKEVPIRFTASGTEIRMFEPQTNHAGVSEGS